MCSLIARLALSGRAEVRGMNLRLKSSPLEMCSHFPQEPVFINHDGSYTFILAAFLMIQEAPEGVMKGMH